MVMKNKFFAVFVIILLVLMSRDFLYSQSKVISLEEALKLALENNYSIQIVKKTSEIANNNVSIGNAGMLPKIDAVAGGSYSKSDLDMVIAAGGMPQNISKKGNTTKAYNASIDLNWTLFDGFAMFISYNKFEELRDKSNIELQIAIENMFRNIINSYFEGLKLQERLKILGENLQISRNRLERVRGRAELGAALKVEVFKAEVDLNIDSSAYLQTKLAYDNMVRNFNYLVGNSIDEGINFDNRIEIDTALSMEELLQLTMNKNSSLNKAIKERVISELDYDLINSQYYPRISFKTGYSYSRQENDAGFMLSNQTNGFSFGLNAAWNLYDGQKTSIQSQNARVNVLINELKYQDIEKQIKLSFVNAFNNYKKRVEILEIEKYNLKSAQANFERSLELYNLGQLTSIEFREAQVNLMNAKNRINEALYSLKIAETELLILSGNFLSH